MRELLNRLREEENYDSHRFGPLCKAAADEIERLRAFIAKVAECQDSIGREASEVLIS